MSKTEVKLELASAEHTADYICTKIDGEKHVVGSVRRRKSEVGDIELLVHKKAKVRLELSAGTMFPGEFETIKGGPTERNYGQWLYWKIRIVANGVNVDLYRFNDDNRGSMLIIRTGPAEFSKKFVIALKQNGLCHSNGYIKGDRDDAVVPCSTERKAFEFAGLVYKEPWERT